MRSPELGELDRRLEAHLAFVLEDLKPLADERLQLPVLGESAPVDGAIFEPVDLFAYRFRQESVGDLIGPDLAVGNRPGRARMFASSLQLRPARSATTGAAATLP